MDRKILVVSGRKCSGKTSLANFLTGYEMRRNKKIKAFDVDDQGRLLVNTVYQNAKGVTEEVMGVMELDRMDIDFIEYAIDRIWPFVKIYNFADRLKQILMLLFGVRREQLYGTDDEKNTPTSVKWSDVRFLLSDERKAQLDIPVVEEKTFIKVSRWEQFMTGRELAQVFGSEICRKISPNCWVDACVRDIENDNSDIAIVADARFPNELDLLKAKGAKLVRLLRNPFNDNHVSETALDSYPLEKYDLVIDNTNMSIEEKNWKLLYALLDWKWVGSLD